MQWHKLAHTPDYTGYIDQAIFISQSGKGHPDDLAKAVRVLKAQGFLRQADRCEQLLKQAKAQA